MPSQLDLSYQATVRKVRARVEAFVLARFDAGQYRDADLQRFVAQVVPVVLAGQRQVSALTNAYLATVLTQAARRPVRALPPQTDYPRGVDPAVVYARPFVEVRTKLSLGLAFVDAVTAGRARAQDIARTDVQLARTHSARSMFETTGIRRFRRVLTGSKSCALCYIASTQTYSRDDLLPIHPGCDCSVAPVVGDFDRDAELSAAHEAIAERFGDQAVSRGGRNPLDYRKAIVTHEHGEIGPVLTLREHQFTGPSAV